jgi:hypothetical protein
MSFVTMLVFFCNGERPNTLQAHVCASTYVHTYVCTYYMCALHKKSESSGFLSTIRFFAASVTGSSVADTILQVNGDFEQGKLAAYR